MSPEIISSLITGGSDGGGGHTKLSIMSSVARKIPAKSGGSVRDDRIIIQRANSSWSTLSRYIISKSDTIAPFITIISSLFMIPTFRESINKTTTFMNRNWGFTAEIGSVMVQRRQQVNKLYIIIH